MKINKKQMLGILLVAIICAAIVAAGNLLGEKKAAVVLDKEGNEIAQLFLENGELTYECGEAYRSYIDIVKDEALDLVAKQEKIEKADAAKRIVSDRLEIHTSFSEKALQEMQDAVFESGDAAAENYALALGDLKGHLIACYSVSADGKARNYVTFPTYAGSAIKPLSVYTPALEERTIHWSSLFLDIPYAWVEDEHGELKEWPQNTKPFTDKKLPVEEAVATSNNTIAVKALKKYGVEKFIHFLREKFGIATEKEENILQEKGEDRVLSNLALGYLKDGVSVKQMTEAYQIYANGGLLYPLHAVTAIQKNGQIYYKETEKPRRIIREETACIMNHLMRKVVEEGTGKDAQIEGINVSGKTGTSEYGDHWFAGVTPQYVCAVRYQANDSIGGMTASAVKVFKDTIEGLEPDKDIDYSSAENVCEEDYCKKSGLLAGEGCVNIGKGYYEKGVMPKRCEECK